MFINYFKIARRNLWRNRIFSLINLLGLALGITAFVFILQYVSYEYSYNRMHKNLPQIHRLLLEAEVGGELVNYDYTPPGLAPLIKEKFSEINNYCRIAKGIAAGIISYTKSKQDIKSFREKDIAFVDASFFKLFDFPIIKGNPEALQHPNQIAISESYNKKFFGRQNPIGKTLTIFNQFGKVNYTVAAIFEDFPSNSDIQLEILLSIQTLANPANRGQADWAKLDGFDSNFLATFILLNQNTNAQELEHTMNQFKQSIQPKAEENIVLQAAEHIHLGQSLNDKHITYGSLGFVYLMSIVGVLILVIAWLNYVNLSTALSLKRAKEVGIRKVIGAQKRQLIFQFMGESLLLNAIGLLLAVILIEIFQNYYNTMTDQPLSLWILVQNGFWLWGIAFLLLGTLSSGAYTAFQLSSFQPVQTLKGIFSKTGKGLFIRKMLVVFQFSISITLIASTIILYKQLQYMQNTKLGMNPEQLMVVMGPALDLNSFQNLAQKKEIFTDKIKQLPFVENFCMTGTIPSKWYNFNTSGITKTTPRPDDDKKSYAINIIDHRYLDTYQIKLLAGQNFFKEDCKNNFDDINKVILNEKAYKALGFNSPEQAVNQSLKWGKAYKIAGVIQDYHHQALHSMIEPMIFVPQLNTRYYTLKLNTHQLQKNIQSLKKLYEESFPGNPYEYFFVDEQFNRQYQQEIQYGRIFTSASLLAIFIACLGLFGLAAFTVEQRTKEIGIRKVMGASLQNIVGLMTRDFMQLVLIAFIIATPCALYFSNRWLQDFAYKTIISWWIFVLAGGLAIFIAFLTVAWHSFRAASTNPVEILRHE